MKKTKIPGILIIPILLLVLGTCENPPERPNIILIYADDLGIGLLGHEGQQIISTPNIDRLASEGIRFLNSYACMLCAPARASLLTGRHDCHSPGFEITNAGIYKEIGEGSRSHEEVEQLINSKLTPVSDDQVFLGQVAQEAGYRTAQFGKLEWGFATSHAQMKRHGWDSYFGYLDHVRAHGFYPPYLFSNGELIKIEGNTFSNCGKSGEPETQGAFEERWDRKGKEVYSQTVFMDSVLSFLESNKDHPFFLYFPTQLPHGPVAIPETHPDFLDDPRLTQIEKEYASMVKLLDDNVGQILDKLKELNIDDKTMVIFTADNGHEIYYEKEGRVHKPYTDMSTGIVFDNVVHKYYSEPGGDVFDGNGGRAGLKRSNLQGGIVVPLLIRWPDQIAPGSTSKRMVANYDLLPTIAELTGFEKAFKCDGLSFCSELLNEASGPEHEYLVYSSFEGPTLITNDGWKIRTVLKKNVIELYDLNTDFREEHKLAEKHPEKLQELKDLLLEACEGDLSNGLYSWGRSQIPLKE